MSDAAAETARKIEAFLAASTFAVFGASADPRKFGHRCYDCYLRHGRAAFPINPNAATVLGHPAYPDLASVPVPVEAVTIVTPPAVTERILDQVIAAGVRHVWMQPGAESPAAVEKARGAGLSVISGGPCLLVVLGCA